jgi:hypothetical protein
MLKRDAISKLLKLAGAPDNAQTRQELQSALDWAHDLSTLKVTPVPVIRRAKAAVERLEAVLGELVLYNFTDRHDELEKLLRDFKDQLLERPIKKGQPEKSDRLVVEYALSFFKKYSKRKPSTDPKNPFTEFAEKFYEEAIGRTVKCGGLSYFIRGAIKKRAGD